VVDDEPGLRQSLGLLLSDAGYEVVAEGDARRAIERALAEPFDMILCDVRMPDLDGIAFVRRYRAGDGTALVIMMSAYGGEDAALAAMKEGAYDYLPKPFPVSDIYRLIERVRQDLQARAELRAAPAGAEEELARRLRARGTEEGAALERRLAEARREMAEAPGFDHVVVNDRVGEAVAEVLAIIDVERRDPT